MLVIDFQCSRDFDLPSACVKVYAVDCACFSHSLSRLIVLLATSSQISEFPHVLCICFGTVYSSRSVEARTILTKCNAHLVEAISTACHFEYHCIVAWSDIFRKIVLLEQIHRRFGGSTGNSSRAVPCVQARARSGCLLSPSES